ncbi:MAG: DEAD/DEAH box helicase [Actinobacteria bacterium]|nr:MAG: DEAD/DEAH box helicase [Actinomycetota bacterium]
MTPARAGFLSTLGFRLDSFQTRALDALDEGRSVLVAAPTGSGKTVVAEYAVVKALAEGGKAFYTTPLKALSNQKFADLVRRHGPERVGLLTGDNSINGDAPVVVMTTEVLRNMIYAGSPALAGLRCVVLDEVHYLQNPYRGAVWEEVIIHSPPRVTLVCLSATVSNAEEFADWISTVRGDTAAIIEERRPVALNQLYLVGDRRSERLHLLPTFVDGRPNPEAAALEAATAGGRPGRPRSRLYAPWRSEVVDRLDEESMLPAIYFIFSRAACDDAVRQCLDDGVRLTTPEERRQIRAIAEAKVEALSDDDLRVLGYGAWLTGLEAGLGAHHAGLVPPFKEAVEACFGAALVKVVFATETLSLGINMPARSVVIEKLTKFSGERHETLTAGEYTQLTGRAGRRGIDEVGHAVVLWSRFVAFSQVAGLASTRTYALTSSFRPTYNMTANLVRRYPPDQAHHLLNLSFAQYRADADLVHLEAQLERTMSALADARRAAACDRGDIEEYRRLHGGRRGGNVRGGDPDGQPVSRPAEIQDALARIRPGDVLMLPGAVAGGRVAVTTTARRRGGDVRLGAVSVDTRKVTLRAADFPTPPRAVARVELPVPYDPSTARFVRQTAAALRRLDLDDQDPAGEGRAPLGKRRRARSRGAGASEAGDTATSHPVAGCPQLRVHLRAAERAERLERERERLERRVRRRSESLARQFDRVLELLRRRGFVEGWSLTDSGERLARIYHEADLLVAETLGAGLLDDLEPAAVAALVSVFTYEPRGPGPATSAPFGPPTPAREAGATATPAREAGARATPAREAGTRAPPARATGRTAELQRRWRAVEGLAARLGSDEAAAGLPPTRPLDPGFSRVAHAWAAGDDLSRVIADEDISGGDFVRNVKQLIDLLRQIEQVAPVTGTARAAGRAADDLFRDIVSASSVVDTASAAAS